MPHHHHGRSVKTFDEQAAFLIYGKVEWAKNAVHTLVAQPGLGSIHQGPESLGLILSFQ
jgi:hypothetical protein